MLRRGEDILWLRPIGAADWLLADCGPGSTGMVAHPGTAAQEVGGSASQFCGWTRSCSEDGVEDGGGDQTCSWHDESGNSATMW